MLRPKITTDKEVAKIKIRVLRDSNIIPVNKDYSQVKAPNTSIKNFTKFYDIKNF